jgi:hypothetical protein
MLTRAIALCCMAGSSLLLALGCVASPQPGQPEEIASTRVQAYSREDAVARARQWVDAQMPYCGGPNGGADLLCDGTCVRTGEAANPAWNPYRSDWSGLISYAWGLPAPGRTTYGFAPFDKQVSYVIAGDELEPGDALNSSGHIVLFAGWVDRSAGKARIIEEYNCGKVAIDHVLTLSLNGSSVFISDWSPKNYVAIRYVNMEEGGSVPSTPSGCGDLSFSGQCDGDVLSWCEGGKIKTYDCAANGKTCGYQDDSVGHNCIAGAPVTQPAGCGDVSYEGKCDGETLVWCEKDVVMTYNCAGVGKTCGYQDTNTGYNCIVPDAASPDDPCGGITYQGKCSGSVLEWCENGAVKTFDCASKSQSCGYQDDTVGYNCL